MQQQFEWFDSVVNEVKCVPSFAFTSGTYMCMDDAMHGKHTNDTTLTAHFTISSATTTRAIQNKNPNKK